MPKITAKIIAIFLLLAAANCSDDKTYDKTKAVSAFADIDYLSVDKSLSQIELNFPKQKKNSSWNAYDSLENSSIENYEFAPIVAKKIKNQKFLTTSSSKWSGSRPWLSDRFVFEPAIKDNKVFLLDAAGILWGYNLENKKRIFKNRLFKRIYLKTYQSPKIFYAEDKIFAIAGSNEIVAASAVDGKILWSKTILSLPVSKPVSDGKMVYVTTVDNKTYALNAESGDLIWTTAGVDKPTAIFGAANPVLYKDKLIVAYSSGEIYGLNKKTGEALFSQDLNISKAINSDFYLNDIDATPIVKNDIIFAIGNGGLMMAINATTGNYIWKKEIASISDFWAVGDWLFVIDNRDKLVTLSQKTGAIKSVLQLPDFRKTNKPETKIIYNGVILIGNKLVISNTSGNLLVVDAMANKIEQVFGVGKKIQHAPTVANGKIYLHATDIFTIKLIEIR